MFSFSTCRFFLLASAACNVMTSAEPTVNLGEASHYAILAKSGISTVPSSDIYGDIGVSPIAADAMTGFDLTLDSSGQYSTSSQIHASSTHPGRAYAADYGGQTAADLTDAVSAMEAAYTDAAGRTNDDAARKNVGGGTLGGDNPGGSDDPLTPGVYTFGTNVQLTGDVYFSGDRANLSTDVQSGTGLNLGGDVDSSDEMVYIIQISGNLVQAANYNVILGENVEPENIFWQVAGFVEVGAGANMQGIILAKTKADFITGSSLNGRVLTQTACNLQKANITEPDSHGSTRVRRNLRSS
jgi:hypothetical protein